MHLNRKSQWLRIWHHRSQIARVLAERTLAVSEGADGRDRCKGVFPEGVLGTKYRKLVAVIALSHFCLRFGFLSRNLLHITERKVSQNCRNVVAELLQSCRKIVAKLSRIVAMLSVTPLRESSSSCAQAANLGSHVVADLSQSCCKAVAKLSPSCRKVVAMLSQSCRRAVAKLSQNCRKVVAMLSQSCRKVSSKICTCLCHFVAKPLGGKPLFRPPEMGHGNLQRFSIAP